jgi:hypothetical protein
MGIHNLETNYSRYAIPRVLLLFLMLPFYFAYVVNIAFLRFFSLLFDYFAFARSKLSKNDKGLIYSKGHLPSKNESCRIVLLYAKDCHFNIHDINLLKNVFNKFSGHKAVVINCSCEQNPQNHRLEVDFDFILIKPNWGYDFDAYSEIISMFAASNFSTLTFVNNSIITLNLDNNWISVMEEKSKTQESIVGLIQSISPRIHFQTFAFTISKKALAPALLSWFKRIRPLRRKQAVVRFYEIGLAKKLQTLKVRVDYIFQSSEMRSMSNSSWEKLLGPYIHTPKYSAIKKRTQSGLGVNPTHHHWRFILSANIPIIKKELIVSNPDNLPDVLQFVTTEYPSALSLLTKNHF